MKVQDQELYNRGYKTIAGIGKEEQCTTRERKVHDGADKWGEREKGHRESGKLGRGMGLARQVWVSNNEMGGVLKGKEETRNPPQFWPSQIRPWLLWFITVA